MIDPATANAVGGGIFKAIGGLFGSKKRKPLTIGQQVSQQSQASYDTKEQRTATKQYEIDTLSKGLGLHPMVMAGGSVPNYTGAVIDGQTNRGSIAKDISSGVALASSLREQDARTNLLKAQAKAISGEAADEKAAQSNHSIIKGANDAPALSEPNQPTQIDGKVYKTIPNLNLGKAFANPAKVSQEAIETRFGGLWGELFGIWKGVQNLGDNKEKVRVFNERAKVKGMRIHKGKFQKYTKRGWKNAQ